MIETEKRTIEVEEFSPTEPLYRENVIRHLVRLASLIAIGLLGINVVQNNIPDFEVYLSLLFFALVLVFFAGILVSYFQLRWVNEQRKKSTNIGGALGFFGLVLILVCSVSSLMVWLTLTILIPLLGLGILLTFIGFFAEMTRIDEPLVFWFRVNLENIIRYSVSGIGAFLVNYSLLSFFIFFFNEWGVLNIYVFPGDLIGGLMFGGIGWGLVWISWFHQINQTFWRYRVEIIRTIVLTIGLGLILGALIVPFSIPDISFLSSIFAVVGLVIIYLDLYLFKVKVTSHFSKGFVTFGKVTASLTGLFFLIIGIIQTSPEWFFFRIFFPVTGLLLLYRVWFDDTNSTIKRIIQTTVWFFRTYYREVVTFVGVSFMLLGTLLIEFTKLINPLLLDVLFIDSFFDPLPIGLFLGGFGLAAIIWHIPTRHDYFRGVITTLSFAVVLWGVLLLGLLLTPPVSSDELSFVITSSLIFIAIFVDGVLWRTEIYHSVKKLFITIKDTLIYTGQAIFHFLKRVLHSIWDHRVVIIRTITTTSGAIFLLAGLFPITQLNVLTIRLALILGALLLLYITWFYHVNNFIKQSAMVTWNTLVRTGHTLYDFLRRVKNGVIAALHTIWFYRIVILRGAATVLGPLMILSVAVVPFLGFPPETVFLIQVMLFIVGIGILYAAWFYQVNHFIKQAAVTIRNVFVLTVHAIKNFFVAVKNTLIQAVRVLIQFFDESLRAIWENRITIFRGFLTFFGSILASIGLLLFFYRVYEGVLLSGLELLLILLGLLFLYMAWFQQVNQFLKDLSIGIRDAIIHMVRAIYDFLIATKNAIVNFLHYTWNHRIDILRAVTTTIGFLLVLAGLFPTLELVDFNTRIVLILGGVILLYIAWIHQVNNFVKQSAIAIHDGIVKSASAIKNFIIAVKNAIIQTIRAFFQFLKDTYHAIVRFFQTYYREIIRYSATFIGGLFVLIGFFGVLSQDTYGMFLVGGGLIILYAAWFRQINSFIIKILKAIRDAIIRATHAFHNFLVNVKNAIVKALYAFGSFLRTVGIQLNQLLHTTIDLTIPIVLVVLAISVLFYGFILLISGVIPGYSSGVQISEFFFSIPILGPIINFTAAIIQGEAYSENILGVFADQVFLIPLGAALIVIGGIIFLFVALKKENMRLQSIMNPKDSSGGDE